MKNIEEFVGIPKFVESYIKINEPGLENLIHDFCKLIMETEYEIYRKDNELLYEFKVGENYTIKRFIDFYFDKSKLNFKLQCKYEDEVNLPKSILNEIFVIGIDSKPVTLYIDSYKDGVIRMVVV